MKVNQNKFLIISVLFATIFGFYCEPLEKERTAFLPGRALNTNLHYAKFGKMKLFFYMTEEKEYFAKEFLKDINDNLSLGIYKNTPNFGTPQIIPLATLFPDPVGYSLKGDPLFVDNKGGNLFKAHTDLMQEIAEKTLGVSIKGVTRDINLVLNFDTHAFHQDNFDAQYEFLNNHPKPIPKYHLVQDLTLTDWQMGSSTISGTIIQDPQSEDRFILSLFSGEVVGNFFAEPALYNGPNQPPDCPGHSVMPFHCVMPPIDLNSEITCGSSKGKRTSVVFRGLVEDTEIDLLLEKANEIEVNRPENSLKDSYLQAYSSGIEIKKTNFNFLGLSTPNTVIPLQNNKNFDGYKLQLNENIDLVEQIAKLFYSSHPPSQVEIRYIEKRDGGFSSLTFKDLSLRADSDLFVVNVSQIPPNYKHYPLSQDFTPDGVPWVQMYHFPTTAVMHIPSESFEKISLTPTDEILYRDEIKNASEQDIHILKDRIITKVYVISFAK